MRILILGTHLNCGGISRYIINLARGLKYRGHTVYVATCGGEWESFLKEDNIQHIFIPIKTKSILSPKLRIAYKNLKPFIQNKKIDIIHANTRVTQYLAYKLFKTTGIKYVSTFHGFYTPKLSRRYWKFEGVRTIAISQAVKDHLINDLFISSQNIDVVYNGIDIEYFSQERDYRNIYGYKEDGVIVGMLGRISQEKGHFLALDAVLPLLRRYNNLYFFVCGGGKLLPLFKKRVKKEDLKDKVRIMSIPPDDFLGIIDILVFPSSKEGLGFSILEAFAKKKCVVASAKGGIREIVRDLDTGLIFDPYNEFSLRKVLEKVILDKELRRKVGINAFNFVQGFSIENMAEQTEAVYKKILSR